MPGGRPLRGAGRALLGQACCGPRWTRREVARSGSRAPQRTPEEGRQVIRAVFEAPLTVTPMDTEEGKRFWIQGSASILRMLTADGGCLDSASPARRGDLDGGGIVGEIHELFVREGTPRRLERRVA